MTPLAELEFGQTSTLQELHVEPAPVEEQDAMLLLGQCPKLKKPLSCMELGLACLSQSPLEGIG